MPMPERKICVITGTRADYGLLQGLMREIADDPDLRLQTLVTGTHLSPAFGDTYREIEADGFAIDARVDIGLAGDDGPAIARAMGAALGGIGDALTALTPDIVVVLGDRYEILAAAAAAAALRLPIAHIHGGEITTGAIDDAMRHAISKLAHLHFVAADDYRRRVIQLGEIPERVFTVGAPGLDNYERLELLDREELGVALGFSLSEPYFLATYHPATLDAIDPAAGMRAMLEALAAFPNHRTILTGVNADHGHDAITAEAVAFVERQDGRAMLKTSLGQRNYLSALKHAACVVGNSSSGIIEAPHAGTPTVNIGGRQGGRLRAASIVDCENTAEAISTAIARAVDPAFAEQAAGQPRPYGVAGASARIKQQIKAIDPAALAAKVFYDLPIREVA